MGEPAQPQHPADVVEVVVDAGHAHGGVDHRGPQAAQHHGDHGGNERLGDQRVLADIDGAHHHGHQRQPGQRRHRLEQLNHRIEGAVQGVAEADQNAQRNRQQRRQHEARRHRHQAGEDLVDKGGAAGVGKDPRLIGRIHRLPLGVALTLTLIEGVFFAALRGVLLKQGAALLPHVDGPGESPQ